MLYMPTVQIRGSKCAITNTQKMHSVARVHFSCVCMHAYAADYGNEDCVQRKKSITKVDVTTDKGGLHVPHTS